MADPEEFRQKVAVALRVASARLRILARHASEQAVILAGVVAAQSAWAANVAAEQSAWAASVAAEQSAWAARVTSQRVQQGMKVASMSAQQGAIGAMEYARALGQTREMLPTIKRCVSTAYVALEELKQSEALQLRRLEDLPSFADYASRWCDQLDLLAGELRRMPRSAVIAASVLALRLVAAVNAIGDAAIDEMLHGRTLVSKFGLAAAALPGWLALYHYRHALMVDLPTSPRNGEAKLGSGALLSLQKLEVMARNSRRLPPAFWLSIAVSGSVALQVAKQVTSRTIRGVLRFRMKLLLSLAALHFLYSRFDEEWARKFLTRCLDALPAPMAEAFSSALRRLKAMSGRCVELSREALLPRLRAAARSLGSPCKGGGNSAAWNPGADAAATADAEGSPVRGGPVFHGLTVNDHSFKSCGDVTQGTLEGEEDTAGGGDSVPCSDQVFD